MAGLKFGDVSVFRVGGDLDFKGVWIVFVFRGWGRALVALPRRFLCHLVFLSKVELYTAEPAGCLA